MTPSPHMPKTGPFYDEMIYCSQLIQQCLIDCCNLLSLYKFQHEMGS